MAGDITTIARPYAEAVFAEAQEKGQIDAWGDALAVLSSIAGAPEMAQQIANPNVPRERLCDAILEIAGSDQPKEARNLVRLLAQNNRLSAIPEIAEQYDGLKIENQGQREVHVLSAFELNEAQRQEIVDALKKRLGTDVELTIETDPSLIGGIEIRAGDLVIDGSVRGKLHKLSTELQF
jgi:F-type H+-transporting ATPase subunit delta